ncbi:hypothetical protein PVAP13_9KG165000 [Panicum virgatum]|uniref:Uncharacterized protein n=1 Tax=Panicum virgatum TaxID=38727 RepID=A0A8T0NL11_PANVG|nr:hypothetical protein PVAP13_9KG165000 [Panicum virgatum]
MMRRGSQEPPAGDGDGCDRPASAFGRSKQSAWAPAAGAGVARTETGGALGWPPPPASSPLSCLATLLNCVTL